MKLIIDSTVSDTAAAWLPAAAPGATRKTASRIGMSSPRTRRLVSSLSAGLFMSTVSTPVCWSTLASPQMPSTAWSSARFHLEAEERGVILEAHGPCPQPVVGTDEARAHTRGEGVAAEARRAVQRHSSRNLACETHRIAVAEGEGRAGGARRRVAEPSRRHGAATAGQPTPTSHRALARGGRAGG
eukprot:scaffold15480_cov66-Phaeocystis_antarctica.AAC.4